MGFLSTYIMRIVKYANLTMLLRGRWGSFVVKVIGRHTEGPGSIPERVQYVKLIHKVTRCDTELKAA